MSAPPQPAETLSSTDGSYHEAPEVDLCLTLISTAAIVGMVVLTCIASGEIFRAVVRPANERSQTPLYGQGLTLPVEPRLEGIEMMSNARDGAASSAPPDRIQTYGWVDREKGVVRIPIQRAMELAIERGWLPKSRRGKGEPAAAPETRSKSSEQNKSSS